MLMFRLRLKSCSLYSSVRQPSQPACTRVFQRILIPQVAPKRLRQSRSPVIPSVRDVMLEESIHIDHVGDI
jgi:hypothetical protein